MTRAPRTSFAALAVVAATAVLPASAHAMPTITEYNAGLAAGRVPYDVTTGPGGKLWTTLNTPAGLASLDPTNGAVTEFSSGFSSSAKPTGMTYSGGRLFYTLEGSGKIGWTTDGTSPTDTNSGMSSGATPRDIAAAPSGDLFYTDPSGSGRIGRLDPATVQVTEHTTGLTANRGPENIVQGPGGAMWFTERSGTGAIGRIDPATNAITEFSSGLTPNAGPDGITVGPDEAIWFTENSTAKVGRMTPGGPIQEFPIGGAGGDKPIDIVTGADGNLWFTRWGSPGSIGRITPTGITTSYNVNLTASSKVWQLTSGPDGNVWFTENASGRIGRITVGPGVTKSRGKGESGTTATFSARLRLNSQATTYVVEYGRTTALGQSTQTFAASAVAGPLDVDVPLSGLEPDTEYFARFVATNASDVTTGPIESLRTKAVTSSSDDTPSSGGANTVTPPVAPDAGAPTTGAGAGDDDVPDTATKPKLGKTLVLMTKNGKVKYKKPGHGGGYVTLGPEGQLPVGTTVDARNGHVLLTTALDASGTVQTGEFWGGQFRVDQAAGNRGVVDLVLVGGNFGQSCKTTKPAARHAASAARHKAKAVRSLWGSDRHGKFRTRGRDSVATVRGTKWLTQDSCAGTTTKVSAGAVDLTDLRTKRTVLVKARHSYLVRHKR